MVNNHHKLHKASGYISLINLKSWAIVNYKCLEAKATLPLFTKLIRYLPVT